MCCNVIFRTYACVLFGLVFFVGLGPVHAGLFCSDFPGYVIDGRDPLAATTTQITPDADCTFQNFPPLNPLLYTINFQVADPYTFLLIFNNVVFSGNMACSNVAHKIWFANSTDYGFAASCLTSMVAVESMQVQSPQNSATIGEPFTYTLTFPSMGGTNSPSPNDLYSVALWSNLGDSGADMSLVSINAYTLSGVPVDLVPETNPGADGGVWSETNLSYEPIPFIAAGEQVVVEMILVLNDTPANAGASSFSNTLKWSFGRLVDKTLLPESPDIQFYAALPGEWGRSPVMSVAPVQSVPPATSGGSGAVQAWTLLFLCLAFVAGVVRHPR